MEECECEEQAETSTPRCDVGLGDVRVLGQLGKGSGGVVQRAVHEPTGKHVAIKKMPVPTGEEVQMRVAQELRALRRASSDAIVSLYKASVTDGTISLVLEYMDGGSLRDMLVQGGRLPAVALRPIAAAMLRALAYLHSRLHVVHRDVKPANVLVNRAGEAKLADLGVSSQLADSLANCQSWVGTMKFMSPERLRGEPYSYCSDTWSLGLSLFECVTGAFPYQCDGKPCFWDLLDNIVHQDPPTIEADHDEGIRDLVSRCLKKDPQSRPLPSSLLSHPFPQSGFASQSELSSLVMSRLPDGSPR